MASRSSGLAVAFWNFSANPAATAMPGTAF